MKHRKNQPPSQSIEGLVKTTCPNNISDDLLSSKRAGWLLGLFLIIATLLAYQPVWHAGFIWDDDQYVTGNTALHTIDGLQQIWLVPGVTAQYYPLTFTTFWLEFHLWGLHPLGYHLVNVLLHAINAILLGLLLRRLRVPGAWLAAGIFGLHPVCVESVAWVTERKNTLSGLFYLGSLLAAIRFWLSSETQPAPYSESGKLIKLYGNWRFYWLALALYACALCSKTTAIPLPVIILLLIWWKRGKIDRREAYLTAPFLVIGMVMGLITMHVENNLGASGSGWNLPLIDRCLIAGNDFWFYLGKLFWPHPLIFIYPRWKIAASSVIDYLPIVAMVGGLFILWFKRAQWGRGPIVGLTYFVVLLSLVFSFFNIYFFRYSYVSDHFQYLASLGPLTMAAAGLSIILAKRNPFIKATLSTLVLLMLGVLTWRQCGEYADGKTMWQATIAKNPTCWMAHNNLGRILLEQERPDEALIHLQLSEEIHPEDATVENNLGSAWLQKRNLPEAYACFQKALAIQPNYAVADNNLGDFFLKQGRADQAIPYLKKALTIQPNLADANYNLGNAFLQKGDLNAAIQQWQKTLIIQPGYVAALNNLGNALLNSGQIPTAIDYFQKAMAAAPGLAETANNLGTAFIENGETARAIQYLNQALKYQPDYVPAQNNLAWLLATSPQETIRNGKKAIELSQQADQLSGGNNPLILRTLAAAYAENGQFTNAISAVNVALQFVPPGDDLAANLKEQLHLYEAGLPFRDPTPAANVPGKP